MRFITQLNLGQNGRLGNQMFQYAAMKCLSLHKTVPVLLPAGTHRLRIFRVNTYNLPPNEIVNIFNENRPIVYNEPHFHYDENFFKIPAHLQNTNLNGFFQSEKYFKDIEHILKREFQLVNHRIVDSVKETIKNLKADHPGKSVVAYHIRRGDNVPAEENQVGDDGSQWRTNKQDYHPLLSQEYIDHSLNEFKDEVKLVFSDSQKDIEWCKENMQAENIYFVGGADDVYDFEFMKQCDHNVISNSSFSWWAAWLNENRDKRVIAPSKWFGKVYKDHDTKDLLPEAWETF
tara:strand:- start:7308 stop:8174 length:867 start_codon:yes stop_codon:yes gene_type:complete